MKCTLTRLVRCMLVLVLTAVSLNILVFLYSRPVRTGFFDLDMFHNVALGNGGHQKKVPPPWVPPPRYNSTTTCPGLMMAKPQPPGVFQAVNNKSVYVYSAFKRNNQLIIIAMHDESTARPTTCQVWYSVKEGEPLHLTEAHTESMPEDHGKKYKAATITCNLSGSPSQVVPYAVSLVGKDRCGVANNLLMVIIPPKENTQFTVCVTPLNYRYSRAYELIEMIEMNKLLGAEKIVFYNHSTGNNVDKVLEMYMDAKEVEVHQWHLPMKVNTWPPTDEPEIHYFAQLAALNDCLYRHTNRSQYIVYQDIDEFIIPYKHDTWAELIRDRQQDKLRLGVFQIKCVFFRKEWPKPAAGFENDAKKFKSVILTNTIRESGYFVHGVRSKYIVNPLFVQIAGIHEVWKLSGDVDRVPESEAGLYHYRSWERPFEIIPRVEDGAIARRYGARLVARLQDVWSRFDGLPMDINISSYGDHV